MAILWTHEKTPRFNGIVRVSFTSLTNGAFVPMQKPRFHTRGYDQIVRGGLVSAYVY